MMAAELTCGTKEPRLTRTDSDGVGLARAIDKRGTREIKDVHSILERADSKPQIHIALAPVYIPRLRAAVTVHVVMAWKHHVRLQPGDHVWDQMSLRE